VLFVGGSFRQQSILVALMPSVVGWSWPVADFPPPHLLAHTPMAGWRGELEGQKGGGVRDLWDEIITV